MAERLLLVGMMGAGKSTVGRRVARTLGWRFVDVDEEVERASGRSVAELFAAEGEDAFRVLEADALAQCLADDDDEVVSVGGGAVLTAGNRARLADAGTVVWLRARPETLAERVGDGARRPLLAGGASDVARRLAELTDTRAALYAEVADAVVDVDELTPEDVADRVVALHRAGGQGGPA